MGSSCIFKNPSDNVRMIPEKNHKTSLLPLLLVSAASLGFEVNLIRYFSISSWSEYGYWIISIVMVGLSISGVVLSLSKDFFLKHSSLLLFLIPLALMVTASLGFYGATLIAFNPLEFQNHELWQEQLWNVGKYYLALFPFFFLSGLYIGLNFILYPRFISQLYAFDLIGGAIGSLGIVGLMFVIHPFYLLTALLPLLLVASFLTPKSFSLPIRTGIILFVFLVSEVSALYLNEADFCQYKAIYPPLHVEGNQVIEKKLSPRGFYWILDNFTERLDIDLSNNYSLLGVDGPPSAYGLYQDGNRLSALPKSDKLDTTYVKASLDTLPYLLRPGAQTLLIGTRGGFKLPEVFSMGISKVVALEPDPLLYSLVSNPQNYGGAWSLNPHVTLLNEKPLPYTRNTSQTFDIIDLSSEFLDQGESNRLAFTQEALQEDLRHLKPGGILSIPSSIRELTVYSLKTLESAREALQSLGIARAEDHLLLYRSAWSSRVLVFKDPLQPSDFKKIQSFCSDRSFDISYYSGISPHSDEVWNEIPPLSFTSSSRKPKSLQPQDSLRDDSLRLLSSAPAFRDNYFFNLTPSTLDRPFFYSVIRLSNLDPLWRQLSLIPREEMGYLVNLAVLIQSVVFALIILFIPWVSHSRKKPAVFPTGKFLIYFSALGLGFLFIEIHLIEKGSLLLGDKTLSFSLVLAGMLLFSGLGSWFSGCYFNHPRQGLCLSMALILPWFFLAFIFIDPLFVYLLPLSTLVKSLTLLLLLAPVAFGLGMPFALGLGALEKTNLAFIPWAWAVNGAFSVIATPLANLIAVSWGYSRLLGLGLLLYVVVWLTFPQHPSKGKL